MFDTGSLDTFQRDFLQTVTAANPPQHPGLRVHHDTWLFGLIDALAEVYPATRHVLGDEGFRAFARDYIRAHPLTGGDCTAYGSDFAPFLAQSSALGELPWLPDLARYEQALHHAHHAEDAAPCDFSRLLDPQTCVALHPSAQVLTSGYEVVAVHAAAVAGEPLPRIRHIPCEMLIGRDPDDTVVQLCLAPLETSFIATVVAEASLMTALGRLDSSPDDMILLQMLLARMVQHGLLITL